MRHLLLFLLVFLTISSCNNEKQKEEIVTIEDNNTALNASRVNPDGSVTYEYIESGTKDTVGTKTTKTLRTITYYESVTDTFRRKYKGVVVSPPPTGEEPPVTPPTGGTRKNLVADVGFDGSNPFDETKMYYWGCCSYSKTQSKTVVRSGDGSFRGETRVGDKETSGGIRTEFIVQDQSKALVEGWYGYSQMFENLKPMTSGNRSIVQWHPTNNGSANLGVYVEGTKFHVRLNPESDESAYTVVNSMNIESNKWYDWVWRIKWDKTNGIIECWINGTKYVDFKGATLTSGGTPYFKIGLNSWSNPNPGTIFWVDNVRVGNASATYNDVVP